MNPNTVIIALVLAACPLPILASVLCLTSENGRAKAAALAAGWIGALAVLGFATVVLGANLDTSSSSTTSTVTAWLDIVLGVAAVVYGVMVRNKSRAGTPSDPAWMARLDHMSPWVALGLGAFIPPYMLVVAGANDILRTDASTTALVVGVLAFTIIGSLGVLVPLLVTVFSKDPDALLQRWRALLLAHWHMVLFWLLALAGVYLVIKGVYELTS
jgi:hypothetical protein